MRSITAKTSGPKSPNRSHLRFLPSLGHWGTLARGIVDPEPLSRYMPLIFSPNRAPDCTWSRYVFLAGRQLGTHEADATGGMNHFQREHHGSRVCTSTSPPDTIVDHSPYFSVAVALVRCHGDEQGTCIFRRVRFRGQAQSTVTCRPGA